MGTLFRINGDGTGFSIEHSFQAGTGWAPTGSLLLAADGKMYGMTTVGGPSNNGVIFRFDPATGVYSNLINFNGTNGAHPHHNLVQLSNGKIYGTTVQGGPSDEGVLFEYNPVSNSITVLHNFAWINGGGSPFVGTVQAANGKLYGTCTVVTPGFAGVLYSYDLTTGTYHVEKTFNAAVDGYAGGNVLQASNGILYSSTNNGTDNIYSFNTNNSVYTNLQPLTVADGYDSFGSLIEATNSKLYGLMAMGGVADDGVLFSYDHVTNTYVKLHDFEDAAGEFPQGTLLQAADGNLYGMTYGGGINDNGTVFKYNPVTAAFNVIFNFDGINGATPYGDLISWSTTGIDEVSENNFSVYPNPSLGLFKVDCHAAGVKTLDVFAADGKAILHSNAPNNTTMLDLQNRAPGIYYLRVVSNTGVGNVRLVVH